MEPGFVAESINIPHVGVRINLGHQFNKVLSVQMDYMRPVNWVQYKNVNGDLIDHSVWMNIAGFTLKAQHKVARKFSVYAEAGYSVVTRNGFDDEIDQVKNANFSNLLTGAGLQYHLHNNWDLLFSMAYSPPNSRHNQPHTFFTTAGFAYYMRPQSPERVKENENAPYIFPHNVLQIGYANDFLGFEANKNFTFSARRPGIPIFWLGDIKVGNGVSITYLRNIYHGRKTFSFDWGLSASWWQSSINKTSFFTLSIFPSVKVWFLHMKSADVYFVYSIAGPAFISETTLDEIDSGKHFTFQDYLGFGTFFGEGRTLNFEARIEHFSNGNLFPANDGIAIPLTFVLGYAF